jgi:hypothetical protein
MESNPIQHEPYRRCSLFYLRVGRDCRVRGFDPEEIARSQSELCQSEHGLCYLHPKAFAPTGVALGFPLPDNLLIRRLWRISSLVKTYLQEMADGNPKTFAHVPPECYHITIVNGRHFDEDEEVVPIDPAEKHSADEIVAKLNPGAVSLFFNGLILSRQGRLLVRGYALDNRLFEIRKALVDGEAVFRRHIPPAAHIKLGHILVNLSREQLPPLSLYTGICGEYINRSVFFEDLYTPLGRIPLVE